MLKMRLQRVGRKHDPAFRIIVTEQARGPKAGRYVDQIGHYNVKHGQYKIDGEKAKLWMGRGAQASDTVWNMLVSESIVDGKKVNALPKKTVQKSEEDEQKEKEAAEAPVAEEVSNDEAAEETPEAAEEPAAETEEVPAEEEKTEDTPAESEEKAEPAESEESTEETDEEKK